MNPGPLQCKCGVLTPGLPGNSQTVLFKLFSPQTGASHVALPVQNMPINAGDRRDSGSVPGSARSAGGFSSPLQHSSLENPMHRRGARWAAAHRVTKSRPRLKGLFRQSIFMSSYQRDDTAIFLYSKKSDSVKSCCC